jgi:pyruvate dehydrogenase E1 component beta subunit
MEHKDLWAEEGDVEIGGDPIPLGKARLVETGRDLTIVSWSGMLRSVAKASELLEADGVTCDVIDLRTLYPWDQNAVYESVARTRRLLVVHESIGFAGFGGEIAAAVAEELGVPVKRLGAPRIPVPYSPALSPQCLISPALIQSAARQLVQN